MLPQEEPVLLPTTEATPEPQVAPIPAEAGAVLEPEVVALAKAEMVPGAHGSYPVPLSYTPPPTMDDGHWLARLGCQEAPVEGGGTVRVQLCLPSSVRLSMRSVIPRGHHHPWPEPLHTWSWLHLRPLFPPPD